MSSEREIIHQRYITRKCRENKDPMQIAVEVSQSVQRALLEALCADDADVLNKIDVTLIATRREAGHRQDRP